MVNKGCVLLPFAKASEWEMYLNFWSSSFKILNDNPFGHGFPFVKGCWQLHSQQGFIFFQCPKLRTLLYISWSPWILHSTALKPWLVKGWPASFSIIDPFGKGSLSGPTHGWNPSCKLSKDHFMYFMMGTHVESIVQDFGKEHMSKCAAKEFSRDSNPPKFQVRIVSLVWNSTPSLWRNNGKTLLALTTCLLARPVLLSRQMGWPSNLSSLTASTFFQKASAFSLANCLSNCSGYDSAKSAKTKCGRNREAVSVASFDVLGSLTGTWTSKAFVKPLSLLKLVKKSLWQFPLLLPQLPMDAMWLSSSDWAPSNTARCAICWHKVALSWPWAQRLKSFKTRPLFALPFVKVFPFLFSKSNWCPLSLLAFGRSSIKSFVKTSLLSRS